MTNHQDRRSFRLNWVMKHMPAESAKALTTFLQINPRWEGAKWDDCLDVLLDSDSNLEVTEPVYEELDAEGFTAKTHPGLISAVTLTCFYAERAFSYMTVQMQAIVVKATISDNDGLIVGAS